MIYNHAALPQKQRNKKKSRSRRGSSNPTRVIPEENETEMALNKLETKKNGMRGSYLDDKNQANVFANKTKMGGTTRTKPLKKSVIE